MKREYVSGAVIRRLPRYYRHLTELSGANVERVSSSALGKGLGLTASQIRQDLSCFGEFGQQGYGYKVEKLRREIADILGIDRGHTAVLLGTGNLGRALLNNFNFKKYGFQLSAAFDIVPERAGIEIAGVPVYHVDTLEDYLSQTPASIGVLTVPKGAAVELAQRLVRSGVKGIWNFTSMELGAHCGGAVVENVHFADSLLTLGYMISEEP